MHPADVNPLPVFWIFLSQAHPQNAPVIGIIQHIVRFMQYPLCLIEIFCHINALQSYSQCDKICAIK